ncbi:ABC transporter ATP-binding protein [Luteimonas wenzhouensis]|uniref:ABC transporter ATP-binding protein n=1 Tax=Luteimonas wenzhouensis TaxID=2599615 RepID=A0A5C5U133_9GAMM|nr:ABC transporter ATP-binding protein [Luteimonas wenzhouensis]TWT19666.1 ABC transporter ATP-binding protein [Luteimonas wenzhouensis]
MESTPPLAVLRGACKRYGATRALDRVDLRLHAGQVTALLGVNGAGKSTAVALLLGLLAADAGEASVFGRAPGSLAVRRQCGAMLQTAALPDRLEVGELLDMVRAGYRRPRSVADCVALAGLDGLLGRRYGKLSGGQQRRVQFALAICGRPRLLFLDEPTTGLDIDARQGLWAAVRELVAEGSAVLLTTHYLEEAEALSDRVAVLDGGRLVAEGSVDEVRARVSLRRIRCRSRLAAEAVAQWPGVVEAAREGEALRIAAEPAEPVVRRLLESDPALRELEIRRAGLADAFLALTRSTDARQEAA